MILFFQHTDESIIAVGVPVALSEEEVSKLNWLFSGAKRIDSEVVSGKFIGSRKEMISPWSTNATDIAHNAGISSIFRIETYLSEESVKAFVARHVEKGTMISADESTAYVSATYSPYCKHARNT